MALDEGSLLRHTEESSLIEIRAATCPSGAAAELGHFCYCKSYAAVARDLNPATEGCLCHEPCTAESCACCRESLHGLRALRARGRASAVVSLLECGPACSCGQLCTARTTQKGLAAPVTLCWQQQKGWCVHAAQSIPQGEFVCQYVGEYVSVSEARRRLVEYDTQPDKGHALLTVRLELPSQSSSLLCCIDATKQGNIARFINHSCDGGNLVPILVCIKGYLLPRVALFAARDIAQGDELSFAYCQAARGGEAAETDGHSRRRCYCGAAACSGYLPSAI